MYQKTLPVKDGKIGEGIKFERIRHITGNLEGTIDRFNDSKKTKLGDRVKHQKCSNFLGTGLS